MVQSIPAYAHSEFTSSNPTNGAVLKESPKNIEISFSDKINLSFDSFRLLDSDSKQIKTKMPKVEKTGNSMIVEIPKLKDGHYVVVYSIVSEDSHVIKGAISFSVGKKVIQNVDDNQISKLLESKKTPTYLGFTRNILQFILYISIALTIFLIVFRVFIFDDIKNKQLNILFYLATIFGITSSILSIGIQAAAEGSFSISKVFSSTIIFQEIDTRIGTLYAIRAVLFILLAVLWKLNIKIFTKFILPILALSILLTIALAGHASSGEYQQIAFIFDIIHVLAASIWFGGLLALPILLKKANYKEILRKFSTIALYCVIAILVTGIFAAWRQIGNVEVAINTFYGKLVLAKMAMYILLILTAVYTRKFTRMILKQEANISDDTRIKKRILKYIYFECLVLIFVMSTTSVLVNAVPARISYNASVTKQVVTKKSIIEITVDQTKFGPNEIHVYVLNKNGTPKQVGVGINTLQEKIAVLSWSNPDAKIDKLPVDLRFLGLNHFISTNSFIPSPGNWELQVRINIDDFNSEYASIKINFN